MTIATQIEQSNELLPYSIPFSSLAFTHFKFQFNYKIAKSTVQRGTATTVEIIASNNNIKNVYHFKIVRSSSSLSRFPISKSNSTKYLFFFTFLHD